MYMSEKTDKVIWVVTDTMGVPILGRIHAKLMNYISYPEIHAAQGQEQSPVSKDSLMSADHVHSLKTTNQSTVYKDCAVYRQSQDCTENQPGFPRRPQSCNQSQIKRST